MKLYPKIIVTSIISSLIVFAVINRINNKSDSKLTSILVDDEFSSISIPTNFNQNKYTNSSLPDLTFAASKSIDAVVHVKNTSIVKDSDSWALQFFYGDGSRKKVGTGSGVIISPDGYIITNYHVIENSTEVIVTTNDNREYEAEIIGFDEVTDIAVLKIKEKGLAAISIGNSDNIQVGEWVLAVGNPFNLTSTVTAGIVSAKARNINLLSDRSGSNVVPIESFIQTDAAVNPGNSGGALVNTQGELVGINTAIASQTGSYSGYSFAVPVNLVKKVMTDLIDYGIVQRGYLGVQIADVTQELVESKNLSNIKGVYVAGVVENGSAEKAGLKEGDVILKIGTKTVNSVAALQEEVGKRRPGDKISVTIRNSKGYESVKEIVLRNSDGETKLVSKEEVQKNAALGATFTELTSKDKEELNISYGVKIKSLNAGKLKSLGLQEGMIILKINNEAVSSVEQLTNKLNSVNRGVLLEIMTESGKRDYVGFGL